MRRCRPLANSGQITVVAFDEDPVTLGAVKEGSFASTVVQQPFEWGYQGMKLMAAYLGGDKSMVPADGLIIIPTKVIDAGQCRPVLGRSQGDDRRLRLLTKGRCRLT